MITNIDDVKNDPNSKEILDQTESVYLDSELIYPYYLQYCDDIEIDKAIKIYHQMSKELNSHIHYDIFSKDIIHSNIEIIYRESSKISFKSSKLTKVIKQSWETGLRAVILTKSKIDEDIYLPSEISIENRLIEYDENIQDFEYLHNCISKMKGKGPKLTIIKCSKFDKLHFAHLKYFFDHLITKCNFFIIYYGCDPKEFEGLSTFKWPIFSMEEISIHPELDIILDGKSKKEELVQLQNYEAEELIQELNYLPDFKEDKSNFFIYFFDKIFDLVETNIKARLNNIDLQIKDNYNNFKNHNIYELIRSKFEDHYNKNYFNIKIDEDSLVSSLKSQMISKVYQVLIDKFKSFFLFRFGSQYIQDRKDAFNIESFLLNGKYLDICLATFLEGIRTDPYHYLFQDYCDFLITNSTKFDDKIKKLKIISDGILQEMHDSREALLVFSYIFHSTYRSNRYYENVLSFIKILEKNLQFNDVIDLQTLIDFYHFRSFAGLNFSNYQKDYFWDIYIIDCIFKFDQKFISIKEKTNRSIMLNSISKYRDESIYEIFKSPIKDDSNLISSICKKMLSPSNFQTAFEEKDKVYLTYKYFNKSKSSLINGPLSKMINTKISDKSITKNDREFIISMMMPYVISKWNTEKIEDVFSQFNLFTNVKYSNIKVIYCNTEKIDLTLPKFKKFGEVWGKKYKFDHEIIKDNFIDEIQKIIICDLNVNRHLRKMINLSFENKEPLAIVALRKYLYFNDESSKKLLAKVLDPYFGDLRIVDLFIDSINEKIQDENSFPFNDISSNGKNPMDQISFNSVFKFSVTNTIINIFDSEKPYLAQYVWYHIVFNDPGKYPLTTLLIKESSFFIDFGVVPTIIDTIVHLRHFFSYNPVSIPIILHCTSLFEDCDCKLLLYKLEYFDSLNQDIQMIQEEVKKFGNFLSLNYKESFENLKHRSSYYQIKFILKIYTQKYNEIVRQINNYVNITKELETIEVTSIFPGMLLTNFSMIDIILPILHSEKITSFKEVEEKIMNIFVNNDCFQILNYKQTTFPLFAIKNEGFKDFVGFTAEDYFEMFRNGEEIEYDALKPLSSGDSFNYFHSIMSFINHLYLPLNTKKYKEIRLNTYDYPLSKSIIYYEENTMYPLQKIFTLLPKKLRESIRDLQKSKKNLKIIDSEKELEKIDRKLAEEEKILDYSKHGTLEDVFNSYMNKEVIDGFTNTSRQIILLGVCRSLIQLNKDQDYSFEIEPRKIFLDDKYYPHLNTFYKLENENLYKVIEDNKINSSFKKGLMKANVFSFGLIMYELITSQKLVSEEKNSTSTATKILNGNLPEFPESIKESFIELIKSCWLKYPEQRPTISDIFYKLAYDSKYCLDDVDMNEYNQYIRSIINDLLFCTSCSKIIEEEKDLFYYSTYPYHIQCVKCMVCHKHFVSNDAINDFEEFLCVTPGLFICKEHYVEYQKTKKLDENVLDEYQNKLLKNVIKESFDRPNFIDYDILKYQPDEIFINNDMINNFYQVNKDIDKFVQTFTIHFNQSPEEIIVEEFLKILDKNMIIIYVEKGSTFIKIAFLMNNYLRNISPDLQNAIQSIKDRLNSSMGKAIVSNIEGAVIEPEILISNEHLGSQKNIQDLFGNKTINLLQNVDFLSDISIEQFNSEVNDLLRNQLYPNWNFIFENIEMYKEAEKSARESIEKSPNEVIIIGQTIICNQNFKDYDELKNRIPNDKVDEIFVFHGSPLKNHPLIVKEHFYNPKNVSRDKKTDYGYFGVGVYATDNPFYAAMYSLDIKFLNINDKASIVMCKAFYNKDKIKQIVNMEYEGENIDDETSSSYGMHWAFVGNANEFHQPITEDESNECFAFANEFVFPNNFQIIPICTFTVLRPEYYILWIDEFIEVGKNRHFEYLKKLREVVEVNVYVKNKEEAANFIELKRRSKVKTIISLDDIESVNEIIEKLHENYHSNIVSLIFSENEKDVNWASENENALFTNKLEFLIKFAQMELNSEKILDFAQELKNSLPNFQRNFNLDENTITKFPRLFRIQEKYTYNSGKPK